MNKKKSLRTTLFLIVFIPLFLTCLFNILFSVNTFGQHIEEETYELLSDNLNTISLSLLEMYGQGYSVDKNKNEISLKIGDTVINGRMEYLEKLKEKTFCEYSIFLKDTRVSTTLKENEKYLLGSHMGEDIYSVLSKSTEEIHTKINYAGEEYFCIYKPIFDNKEQFIGSIAVAKNAEVVSSKKDSIISPNITMSCLLFFLSFLIVYLLSEGMINSIKILENFVEEITNEEFGLILDEKVYNRKDEIGEIGRGIALMRNTLRDTIELDPLTRIYNRRTGEKRFDALRTSCEDANLSFCFAIGDIDFFKKVNDTYGHEAGDEVLKKVAQVLSKSIKKKGFVARWGGEEFMIGIANASPKEAEELLNKALKKIRSIKVLYNGNEIKVTMTFGLVKGQRGVLSEQLFEIADEKLYFGKEHGRNQVVLQMKNG